MEGIESPHARYDGDWYFCWLIERRDTPSPQWLTAGFGWTDVAANAMWFAKREDADYVAGEMDCNHNTYVCEHGFDQS